MCVLRSAYYVLLKMIIYVPITRFCAVLNPAYNMPCYRLEIVRLPDHG